MKRAAAFTRAFSPYRKRHFVHGEDGGLFPSWALTGRYLTDERIENAILGRLVLAYLAATSTKALGLDIDDHGGRGAAYLAGLYDAIIGRLGGVCPSFVAASPRGLHAWYFLDSPFPFRILEARARELLHGLPVEIRPTPAAGLRIPAETRVLSPDNLRPVHEDFNAAVAEALETRAYHAAEILGEGVMPEAMRLTLKERRGRMAWGSLHRVETDAYPITAGTTNEALKRLIPVYRSAGLPKAEAVARFKALLDPGYTGELNNWRRLYKRVESFYRRPGTYYERPRGATVDLFADSIGETLAELWDGDKRRGRGAYHVQARRERIKRLASGIVSWTTYVSETMRIPAERAAWGYLYPYFTKNRAEGYFPLPKNLLFRLDKNYHHIFPFLQDVGFLEPAPYPYVPGAGICRYYRVNTMGFS
ncbi:MAG TPA: hypothetical protein PK535_09835 [Synergistaceae bacterium]|nr:hypothetical protein [Synergistaceae bacterium]